MTVGPVDRVTLPEPAFRRRSVAEFAELVQDTIARFESDRRYIGETVENGRPLPRQESKILSGGLGPAIAAVRDSWLESAGDAGRGGNLDVTV